MGIRLRIILFLILSMIFGRIDAAYPKVNGVVVDSISGQTVPQATIIIKGRDAGMFADNDGRFSLEYPLTDSIVVYTSGYRPATIAISDISATLNGRISLLPLERQLQEVVVKAKKEKYSKKNNPALDLMRKVRNTASLADPARIPYYSYNYYNKIDLALNDFEVTPQLLLSKRAFLADYADTAVHTRKPILLVGLKEKAGSVIYDDKGNRRTIISGQKSEGIDEKLSEENVRKLLDDIMRDVDIYSDNIPLMQLRFVSPLGAIAPDFYKYEITDSITDATGRKIKELSFVPHSPESNGFNGKMYVVDADSIAYVKSIEMRVPRYINLNYVDNIFINQEFEIDSEGKRQLVTDDMSLELQIIPNSQAIYAHRLTSRDKFGYTRREDLSEWYGRLGSEFLLENAENQRADFWNEMRLTPLSSAEAQMGSFTGKLRRLPWFYWSEKVLEILVKGYWEPMKDFPVVFGPMNTTISYNATEGVRLRVGGLTTAHLSPHIFGGGYVAYGCRDHKWKYKAEAEYSFNKKKNHAREFPIHSLRISHRYDIDQIGEHYLFTNPDNVFLSLKRDDIRLSTYVRQSLFEYKLELNNNFSLTAGMRHEIQYATPWLPFVNGAGEYISHYATAGFYAQLRYAPGEKFAQGRTTRLPINLDAPIFTISQEYMPRHFLRSDFCINRTEISMQKRFWFSAFGFADVVLKGGIIWSQVPYPALAWPSANTSYIILPESFSMMNQMEFATDRYAMLDLTYWMNGLILNHIPLVKRAKLREVVSFKALYGRLSCKNNPEYNTNLYRFPEEAHVRTLGNTPYMEIGAGIDNILSILRVDYVWRLSYRDLPGIDRSGLRIALHFQF